MTPEEKRLYHQIHPLKLFTDFSTAFLATFLLWHHMLTAAIILAFVPSIIVSSILISRTNIEHYKDTAFGRYIRMYMDSRIVDTLRFIGFFMMMFGGWYRQPWMICTGFIVIIFCWTRGLFLRQTQRKK